MIREIDIANQLGLSRETVSVVLNGRWQERRICQATRDRVVAASKELGYRPNRLARGLRVNKTNIIGLAIRTMKHPHQAYINEGIVRLLEAKNFEVLVTVAPEVEQTEEIEDLVASHQPEGLIVGPLYLYGASVQPLFQRLAQKRFPLVGYHGGAGFPGDHVRHDMPRVLELGIAHLKELGHERIDHVVAHDVDRAWFAARSNGGQTHAIFGTVENGYSFAEQVRVGAGAPTAYWLEDPLFAVGFLRGLRQRGVRVPEDVAFVTCPIGEMGRYLETSLTTVYPNLDELAQRIVGLMVQRLRGEPPFERQEILLEPHLTVGESTVRAPATRSGANNNFPMTSRCSSRGPAIGRAGRDQQTKENQPTKGRQES